MASVSENVIEARFLAFKTPLSEKFNSRMPEDKWFNPNTIFQKMHEQRISLDLWIDLTMTNRYYNRNEVCKVSSCLLILIFKKKLTISGHAKRM